MRGVQVLLQDYVHTPQRRKISDLKTDQNVLVKRSEPSVMDTREFALGLPASNTMVENIGIMEARRENKRQAKEP